MPSGWSSTGIGEPRPYPTLFVLGPLLSLVGITLGSSAALVTFLAAIAGFALRGTHRIGVLLAGTAWAGPGLGLIALFNPWMYEKLVAGHLTMMLSVSMLVWVTGELCSPQPRWAVLFLGTYVAAFQIQYALLAVPLALAVRPAARCMLAILAGSLCSLLPSIVGIALARSYLAGVPTTTAWQINNSVPLSGGTLLDGYSSAYTSGSGPWLALASILLFALTITGLVRGFVDPERRTFVTRIAVLAVATLLFCSGLRGPIAPIYAALLHVRPILVFRELYDLIGIVLICYLALAATALRGFAPAGTLLILAGALAITAWIVAPPSRWWVPSHTLPRLVLHDTLANQRFALMPWLQPLEYRGRGSGADPDIFCRTGNRCPVNQYEDSFPVGPALAEYTRYGRPEMLEALGVGHIYTRPNVRTNLATLETAYPADARIIADGPERRLHPRPELALTAEPPRSSTPDRITKDYLLFNGDPADLAHTVIPAYPSTSSLDPSSAWVSVAGIEDGYPRFANSIGGAFTTCAACELRLPTPHPREALVMVQGALYAGQHRIPVTQLRWQWAALSAAAALRCRGACAVAAWSYRRVSIPAHAARRLDERTVPFHAWLPFVLSATLPASHRKFLVFRTRYDPSWHAIGLTSLRHVAVDGIWNGYDLEHSEGQHFLLVETTALFQFLAMAVSLALAAAVGGTLLFQNHE